MQCARAGGIVNSRGNIPYIPSVISVAVQTQLGDVVHSIAVQSNIHS